MTMPLLQCGPLNHNHAGPLLVRRYVDDNPDLQLPQAIRDLACMKAGREYGVDAFKDDPLRQREAQDRG